MIRRLTVVSVLVVGLLAVATAPASAGPATTIECGQTITTDVVLSHDLTCERHLFFVGGDDVTVDLNGHTLTRTEPPTAYFEFSDVTGAGVTVRNGTIVGDGIFVLGPDAVLEDLALRRGGLHLQGDGGAALRNRVFRGDITIAGPATVGANVVRQGRIEVDNLERGFHGFLVAFNTVANSPRGGFELCPFEFGPDDVGDGAVVANVFMGNRGPGVLVCDALQSLGSLDVAYNIVAGNDGDGITVAGTRSQFPPLPDPGGPVTLGNNLALFNAGHGINAPWIDGMDTGTVDGGGNTAVMNGQRPRCIGVRCVGI